VPGEELLGDDAERQPEDGGDLVTEPVEAEELRGLVRRAEQPHHRPARRAEHAHAEPDARAEDPEHVPHVLIHESRGGHDQKPQHERENDRATRPDAVLKTTGDEGADDGGDGQDQDVERQLLLRHAEDVLRDRAGEPDHDLHAAEVERHDGQEAKEMAVVTDRPEGAGQPMESDRRQRLPLGHGLALLAFAHEDEGRQRCEQEEEPGPDEDPPVPGHLVGAHRRDDRRPGQAQQPAEVAEGVAERGDLPHVVVRGELGQERRHEVLADGVEHVPQAEEHHPVRRRARSDQRQRRRHHDAADVGDEQQLLLRSREVRQCADQRRQHDDHDQRSDARERPELPSPRGVVHHDVADEVQVVHGGQDDQREGLVGEVEHRPPEDLAVQPFAHGHVVPRRVVTQKKPPRRDRGGSQCG
jgi:hypothetical protein